MPRQVGIFGLGLIGMALAERLLAAGWEVVGNDPDPARGALLRGKGGQVGDPAEVWSAGMVLSAVFDTDQLQGLIEGTVVDPGATLISVSTCDPQRMAGLGASAIEKGITLIEAPISGTSGQLAKGDAVFLVAGEDAALTELEPLFECLGKAHYPVGALGNGNRAKLAINLILGLNRAALAEGLVFAERIGLEPAKLLALAQNSAAASSVMATKGPLMVEGAFEPQGRIAQSHKDFSLILEAAQEQGLPFAATYLEMMHDCVDNGEADFDNAAIIRAISRARC